ncbi:MAG: hypothetical protein K0S47_3186 [Herbinix sp.]|jgi:hypothetical protein|nr:hypothetical protein [Herbinix sp.]
MTNFEYIKSLDSEYQCADTLGYFISQHYREFIKAECEFNGLLLLQWLQEERSEMTDSLKHEIIFNEFCKLHGYDGNYTYNPSQNEYEIVITKSDDKTNNNAGASLAMEEYQELTEEQFESILTMLHTGFQAKFNK